MLRSSQPKPSTDACIPSGPGIQWSCCSVLALLAQRSGLGMRSGCRFGSSPNYLSQSVYRREWCSHRDWSETLWGYWSRWIGCPGGMATWKNAKAGLFACRLVAVWPEDGQRTIFDRCTGIRTAVLESFSKSCHGFVSSCLSKFSEFLACRWEPGSRNTVDRGDYRRFAERSRYRRCSNTGLELRYNCLVHGLHMPCGWSGVILGSTVCYEWFCPCLPSF